MIFLLLLTQTATFFSLSIAATSYDLEVPGANPIRIIEGKTPWNSENNKGYNRNDYNSFESDPAPSSEDSKPLSDNFSEYPKGLHEFLNSYASNVQVKPTQNKDLLDNSESQEEGQQKPKSWERLETHRNNQPNDDKKGWVSLDPVPWSVSKISKWKSHNKPQHSFNDYQNDDNLSPIITQNRRPYRPSYNDDNSFENHHRPIDNSYKPSTQSRPVQQIYGSYSHNRPYASASYAQKLSIQTDESSYGSDSYDHRPVKNGYNKRHDDCDHSSDLIITDGRPSNFPHQVPYYSNNNNRRKGTEMVQPDNHPFSGNGDWVLLSTTKGYKYPQTRQRSMRLSPGSVGVHRSVKLTVLPPLKNSKVNMTTSHGGLLQVESTFETVEQAQKKYAKLQKMKQKGQNKRPVKGKNQKLNSPVDGEQYLQPTAAVTTSRKQGPDSSAVMAAVGAGLLPATMAMFVPMAMASNGRRKRNIDLVTRAPSSLELTLTKSF